MMPAEIVSDAITWVENNTESSSIDADRPRPPIKKTRMLISLAAQKEFTGNPKTQSGCLLGPPLLLHIHQFSASALLLATKIFPDSLFDSSSHLFLSFSLSLFLSFFLSLSSFIYFHFLSFTFIYFQFLSKKKRKKKRKEKWAVSALWEVNPHLRPKPCARRTNGLTGSLTEVTRVSGTRSSCCCWALERAGNPRCSSSCNSSSRPLNKRWITSTGSSSCGATASP